MLRKLVFQRFYLVPHTLWVFTWYVVSVKLKGFSPIPNFCRKRAHTYYLYIPETYICLYTTFFPRCSIFRVSRVSDASGFENGRRVSRVGGWVVGRADESSNVFGWEKMDDFGWQSRLHLIPVCDLLWSESRIACALNYAGIHYARRRRSSIWGFSEKIRK